jgi:hypothetical protein
MKIRPLATASDVIDACGGTVAFAKLIGGGREKQHVSNYRATGRLPHDSYLIVTEALKKRRCSAPPAIWGITEPSKASTAA